MRLVRHLAILSLSIPLIVALMIQEKRLTGEIFRTIHSIGYQQCIRECGRRKHCHSINHSWKDLTCELSYRRDRHGKSSEVESVGYVVSDDGPLQGQLESCIGRPCNENYKCVPNENGKYSCLRSECQDHRDVFKNVQVDGTDYGMGSTVSIDCIKQTYRKNLNAFGVSIICREDGRWQYTGSGSSDVNCYHTCKDPTKHLNETTIDIQMSILYEGDIVHVGCKPNAARLQGSSEDIPFICGPNGRWNISHAQNLNCYKKCIDPLLLLAGAGVKFKDSNIPKPFISGKSFTLLCPAGYTWDDGLEYDILVACNGEGQWSWGSTMTSTTSNLKCYSHCPAPTTAHWNGLINLGCSSCHVGITIESSCLDGFKRADGSTGVQTMTCQSDGTWGPVQAYCT